MKWILSHCCIKLNLLWLSPIHSIHYQLSDEPHLDGQDQDAAGEKVGTFISPAPCVARFLATACSVVFKGTMMVIYKAQPLILLRVGAFRTQPSAPPAVLTILSTVIRWCYTPTAQRLTPRDLLIVQAESSATANTDTPHCSIWPSVIIFVTNSFYL